MRVHVYPADMAGCGHQRLIYPARTLAALGHDITVFEPGEQDRFPITIFERGHVRNVTLNIADAECDVMVIQRPLDWKWQQVIPQLQALGVRVVVDLDDDISALRHAHAMYHGVNPATNHDHNWRHLMKAMLKADTVTVSTPALAAKYGRRDAVTVIPNCVPSHYLDVSVERTHDRPVVGWTGSIHSHPHDLNVMGAALPEVLRAVPFEWRVVGNGQGVRAAMGMEPSVVPYVPVGQYIAEVARFDVGVVPLDLHAFNHAKSWLKGLEMSAVGVPFVASPTDPYREFTSFGAGLLAERPKHWAWHVRHLLTDPVYREEMSEAGREVARRWTFESNAWRWEEVWCA